MYKFNITELDNGLKIVTVPNKKVNTFLFQIIAKTGSEYETFKTQGTSHFLEHMMFKGTKIRTNKDIRREIAKHGAYINAKTGPLSTDYRIKISKKYQDLAVDILSDMYLNSVFPKDKLEKEKGTILSELIRKNESGKHRCTMAIRESYFGKENPGG